MKKQENNQDMESTKKSFLSMGFSLALVICVLLFIFGFKHFLKGREYQGNAVQKEAESSTQDIHKEYLDTDKTFQSGYIMIKDVPEKGIYTSKLPGEKKKKGAVSLKNGQILWASKKGSYEGKTYYHLRNTSYEKLGGYVAITYISSTGVRLRAWADFSADNVVKSVYVGDKVPIKGKVTLKNGDSAYITEEGLYLTTDIQYLNDYTTE